MTGGDLREGQKGAGGNDRRETSGKMEGDWREGRGPVRRTEGGRWEGQKGAGGAGGKDGGTLREWELPLPLRERVGVRGE